MTAGADHLLHAARLVLERDEVSGFANRSRGAALLGRLAIETALARYWRSTAPGAEHASRKAQFVSLRYHSADTGLATTAHQAWAELSAACHHHPYDLAPTAAEVAHWLGVADPVVRRLLAAST